MLKVYKNLFFYVLSGLLILAAGGLILWKYNPNLFSKITLSPAKESIKSFSPSPKDQYILKEAQTYQPDPEDQFTFQYPKKFIVTQTPIEGGGKQILVESTEPKQGFQMTILPFDEPGPLTVGRIKQDIPEVAIKNDKVVTLSDGIEGLSFESVDETIGPTYEIWFVYNGYLYEALTYPEFGPAMQEILKTWKFK